MSQAFKTKVNSLMGRPQNSFEPHPGPKKVLVGRKKAQNDPKILPVFLKSMKLVLLSPDYKQKLVVYIGRPILVLSLILIPKMAPWGPKMLKRPQNVLN